MDHSAVLLTLIGLSMLSNVTDADVGVPFNHDFNDGLHGWTVGSLNWKWTGNSRPPNTQNIPSFNSNGSYIWTQKSIDDPTYSPSQPKYLHYQFVTGVTSETKLHFNYWYYTQDDECGFLAIAPVDRNILTPDFTKLQMIDTNTNDWEEFTIDCHNNKCCDGSSCDLTIFVYGSAGCHDGNGLIAFKSITASSGTALESMFTFKHLILIIVIGRLLLNSGMKYFQITTPS